MRTFSLRSLILFFLIVGLICGWAVDHYRLQRSLEIERNRSYAADVDFFDRIENIRTLANAEAVDVSLLLFALSDPDRRIRYIALDALQKIPVTDYTRTNEPEVASEFERWLLRKEKRP